MYAFDLPTSLTIGEVEHPINYGWKTAYSILIDAGKPDMSQAEKITWMLCKLYPNWASIPTEHVPEAIQKAKTFLDCGREPDTKVRPKLVDWEQDAEIIIPSINLAAGREIREDPNIHWWTVFGWFMCIDKGVFPTVLRIRGKIAKGEKLSKEEKKFYKENARMVELKNKDTDLIRREKEEIKKLLGGG